MGKVQMDDRVYTYGELRESVFLEERYRWVDFEGEFAGTLDAKTWGEKKLKAAMVAYVELDDERLVKFTCWQRRVPEYLGVRDIPVGTRVSIVFVPSARNNRIIAKSVKVIE